MKFIISVEFCFGNPFFKRKIKGHLLLSTLRAKCKTVPKSASIKGEARMYIKNLLPSALLSSSSFGLTNAFKYRRSCGVIRLSRITRSACIIDKIDEENVKG